MLIWSLKEMMLISFKLNTSNQIQLLGGNETSFIYAEAYFDLVNYNVLRIRNTENVDNGIISFGVGDVLDVIQIFKTGLTSTVEFSLPQVLCNSFDSFAGNKNVVFNRNGVEFFRLGTGYSTSNGAPTNLLNVDSSTVFLRAGLLLMLLLIEATIQILNLEVLLVVVVVGVNFICCMSMLMKNYISIPILK